MTEPTAKTTGIPEGACFLHYSPKAKECRICFVAESCKRETKPERDGREPLLVFLDKVAEGLPEAFRDETDSSYKAGYVKDGQRVGLVCRKSDGMVCVTIGSERDVIGPITTTEGAEKEAQLVIDSMAE